MNHLLAASQATISKVLGTESSKGTQVLDEMTYDHKKNALKYGIHYLLHNLLLRDIWDVTGPLVASMSTFDQFDELKDISTSFYSRQSSNLLTMNA